MRNEESGVAPRGYAQLVVFRLEHHEYALPVAQVSEILRMVALTPVPQAPPWLPGMLNLRGRVLPVLDLRTRLGLPARAPELNTPIIIAATDDTLVGLIADGVSDVLVVPSECIAKPDPLAGAAHPVAALARVGDRLVTIFDLKRLSENPVGFGVT